MRAPSHWGGQPTRETPDPTPAEMPVGACKPDTLEEIVARMLHAQKMQDAAEGHESWDEANDFEDEDPDVLLDFSPYELQEMVPESDPGFTQLDPEPPAEAAPAAENSPSSAEASPEAGKPDSSTQANQ